jgi:hypothetical protein
MFLNFYQNIIFKIVKTKKEKLSIKTDKNLFKKVGTFCIKYTKYPYLCAIEFCIQKNNLVLFG